MSPTDMHVSQPTPDAEVEMLMNHIPVTDVGKRNCATTSEHTTFTPWRDTEQHLEKDSHQPTTGPPVLATRLY
jgi:hypothetical protein